MTVNICHFESELSGHNITVDRFWGPIETGYCIQFTGSHGYYIQLTVKEMNDIIKALGQHGIEHTKGDTNTIETLKYKRIISDLHGDIHNLRIYMEDQEKTIEDCFENIHKLRREIDDCNDMIEKYMRIIAKQQIKIETLVDVREGM